MLGGVQELVTKADASILCQYHDGWVVDLAGDQEYTRSKNSHIKDLIVGADTGGWVQRYQGIMETITGVTGHQTGVGQR